MNVFRIAAAFVFAFVGMHATASAQVFGYSNGWGTTGGTGNYGSFQYGPQTFNSGMYYSGSYYSGGQYAAPAYGAVVSGLAAQPVLIPQATTSTVRSVSGLSSRWAGGTTLNAGAASAVVPENDLLVKQADGSIKRYVRRADQLPSQQVFEVGQPNVSYYAVRGYGNTRYFVRRTVTRYRADCNCEQAADETSNIVTDEPISDPGAELKERVPAYPMQLPDEVQTPTTDDLAPLPVEKKSAGPAAKKLPVKKPPVKKPPVKKPVMKKK